MPHTAIHTYPWDLLGDPAAAHRIAGLGIDSVALAAAYHTVRASTPLHPEHRVVDAQHAALYVPVRPEAWRGARLVPKAPRWLPDPDSFGTARDLLRAVGLSVHAWTVLTHNSRLGVANPDLVVQNAFGDLYPYALCPANPDVRDYCRTLATEILHCGHPDGLVLEACGPLGVRHGGHHEKTEGADWQRAQQRLLDLCFCSACRNRYTTAGLDVPRLRELVRAGIDGVACDLTEALGPDIVTTLIEVRTGITAELRETILDAVRDAHVVLHCSPDPWATGPFATVSPGARGIDTFVVTCWPGERQGVANLSALRALAGPDARLGAYVLALPPRAPDAAAFAAEWSAYLAAGADDLYIYHAGLASAARLKAVREALSALR